MDGMNLYKQGPTWWIRFQDHRNQQRRLRGAKSKRTAERIGSNIQKLVDYVSCSQPIPQDMVGWILHKLDPKRVAKLKQWGVVSDTSLAIGQPLEHHLEAWYEGLLNRGRPESYAKLRGDRASKLLKVSGAKYYSDIDAEQVQAVLAGWDGEFSDYTRAHYLSSVKSFCRWMVKTRRASINPLNILPVSRGRPKRVRCALTEAQQGDLITGTRKLREKWGMSGRERSMLYWVAVATGLRASFIRELVVSDVHIDGSYLDNRGARSQNKLCTSKPLSVSIRNALDYFVRGRDRDELMFNLPGETKLARMVRSDAKDLDIPTYGLDFHALRHTFGTTMARNGTHPKTLMVLMDHKTIQMTMRFYTHSFPEDQVAAVNRLPNLGGEQQKKEVV